MIYFIVNVGNQTVKIGYSENPRKRFSDLQVSNDNVLLFLGAIVGDKSYEKRLHIKFKQFRSQGEWFFLTNELKTFINETVTFSNIQELEKLEKKIKQEKQYDESVVLQTCEDLVKQNSHFKLVEIKEKLKNDLTEFEIAKILRKHNFVTKTKRINGAVNRVWLKNKKVSY